MNENPGHAARGDSGKQTSSEYLAAIFWRNQLCEEDGRWKILGENDGCWEVWPARRKFGSEAELELFLAAQGLERAESLVRRGGRCGWWLKRAGVPP